MSLLDLGGKDNEEKELSRDYAWHSPFEQDMIKPVLKKKTPAAKLQFLFVPFSLCHGFHP